MPRHSTSTKKRGAGRPSKVHTQPGTANTLPIQLVDTSGTNPTQLGDTIQSHGANSSTPRDRSNRRKTRDDSSATEAETEAESDASYPEPGQREPRQRTANNTDENAVDRKMRKMEERMAERMEAMQISIQQLADLQTGAKRDPSPHNARRREKSPQVQRGQQHDKHNRAPTPSPQRLPSPARKSAGSRGNMYPQLPQRTRTRRRSPSRAERTQTIAQLDNNEEMDIIDNYQTRYRRLEGRRAVLNDLFVLNPISKPYMYNKRPGCSSAAQKLAARGTMTEREYIRSFMALLADQRAYDGRDFPHMFEHLRCITDDCTRKPWPTVREWSQNIFDMVEKEEIAWEDRQEIQNDRANFITSQTSNPTYTRDDRGPATTTADTTGRGRLEAQPHERPCTVFNSNKRCNLGQHHQDGPQDVVHACSYCFKVSQTCYEHSEMQCRKKTRNNAKN